MQTAHPNTTKKIVIIGGGFAGIAAARRLSKEHVRAQVTLISDKSYFEYYPGMYRMVTGAAPIEVCVSLSEMLPKNVDIIVDRITALDLPKKEITGESGSVYRADFLVLALGSVTTYFNLPGLSELSFGFKSAAEAIRLKNHIDQLFFDHEHPSADEMVSRFHVVIVGGGPSGVEVAGDLTRHMDRLARKYHVDPSFITIDIIERNNRLIPAVHPEASARALARLRSLGVNVFLNRTLMSEEIEQVYLKDMSLKSKTVIWTAGTQINPLYTTVPDLLMTDKKRVKVDEHLEVEGYDGVYVVGDGAGTQYAGLAQTAIKDGNFVGRDLVRRLQNKKRIAYRPTHGEYVIPIGHNWALMSLGPIRLYGLFAYYTRHLIDFMYFAGILSPRKFFSLFFEGFKYR